eukprot:augustus_masked-scaffold_11-processed-gene-2.46-mRNA-1 protein AED:1.00 eAED:1.00 QI:0/-1/0/0/-1/1/1/0/419
MSKLGHLKGFKEGFKKRFSHFGRFSFTVAGNLGASESQGRLSYSEGAIAKPKIVKISHISSRPDDQDTVASYPSSAPKKKERQRSHHGGKFYQQNIFDSGTLRSKMSVGNNTLRATGRKKKRKNVLQRRGSRRRMSAFSSLPFHLKTSLSNCTHMESDQEKDPFYTPEKYYNFEREVHVRQLNRPKVQPVKRTLRKAKVLQEEISPYELYCLTLDRGEVCILRDGNKMKGFFVEKLINIIYEEDDPCSVIVDFIQEDKNMRGMGSGSETWFQKYLFTFSHPDDAQGFILYIFAELENHCQAMKRVIRKEIRQRQTTVSKGSRLTRSSSHNGSQHKLPGDHLLCIARRRVLLLKISRPEHDPDIASAMLDLSEASFLAGNWSEHNNWHLQASQIGQLERITTHLSTLERLKLEFSDTLHV